MSDSSDLSSAPSDVEQDLELTKKDGILKFFSKAAPKPTPSKVAVEVPQPRKKRDPSPDHVFCLADNPDIAFIVMFRSRFTEAFPKSMANFGPQELETDIVDTPPGERAENLLCALLGLLLNRKQDVKAGHYGRALEEAIQSHKSQWAKSWEGKNPLSGGASFASMIPSERLTLLRTMILWSLGSSDTVKGMITASYKQNRHEDDLNQPLSVQPWGSDGDKRRYYLIEGLDDTHFRVYRESNHMGAKRTWWSVAGDIDELQALAAKLENEDGGQKARLLASKMMAAVPRFEATEEKRKRREYRAVRKQQFKRPEPNYSMYEGRTRGKRMKYTFSDDEEDIYSDSNSATNRRSSRNTRTHTPVEPAGPTITQSGRQVKARQGGTYGETILSGRQTPVPSGFDGTSDEHEGSSNGRPRRAAVAKTNATATAKGGKHIPGYNNVDEMTSDEEGDASEQDYGDDEEDDAISLASDVEEPEEEDDDDEDEDGDQVMEMEKKSLIVKLPITSPTPEPSATTSNTTQGTASTNPSSSNPTSQLANAVEAPVMTPTSPLAFRGSPSKPSTLAPPLHVGSQQS